MIKWDRGLYMEKEKTVIFTCGTLGVGHGAG